MAPFPQVSPLEPCAHLSPPPYAPHAPPISFFSIYFDIQLKIFQTDLLFTIRSLEYSIKTPDGGQQVCPKHVELYIKIKLRNSPSCWFLLYEYITMHGAQNVKENIDLLFVSYIRRVHPVLLLFGPKQRPSRSGCCAYS